MSTGLLDGSLEKRFHVFMPKKSLSDGLTVDPFRGVRFRYGRGSLTTAMCPPYDVIGPDLARTLRSNKSSAVHLELPPGGPSTKYSNARKTLVRWRKNGTLMQDGSPCFYLVEQHFKFGGKSYRRTGLLTALGLDGATAKRVLKHEKTLPKHKVDRTRLLRKVKANTSPIFGIYSDAGRRVRTVLDKVKRRAVEATGKDSAGVAYRVWRIEDPKETQAISRAMQSRKLLIADGHHRYEVAREYWAKTREKGADRILAYIVAEEDSGLVVHPTHRVLEDAAFVRKTAERLCRFKEQRSLGALEKALARTKSPYAFGLIDGNLRLAEPTSKASAVPTGFGTDWLARRLFGRVDVHDIVYCHGSDEAVREAKRRRGVAVLVKPFSVSEIRKAVERGGLLPQKSTYFYPKIATGIAFRVFR